MLPSAVTLACLVAMSGCGNDDSAGDDASASSPPRPSETTEASPTTEATTTTTTTTPPATELTTVPAPPEPADGGNVDACFDGDCDVVVALPVDVPIDPALSVASLRLRPDAPGAVALEMTSTTGAMANGVTGPGGVYQLNNVHLQIQSVDGASVRFILTPCAEIEGCEVVTPTG